MDEEYAHFDDSMNQNELYMEHLLDDTEGILESSDPKKPGIDLKLEEAEEQISDALSDSADILDDWGKDNQDDFQYAQEDIDSEFTETSGLLAEQSARYAKTIREKAKRIE